MKRVVVTGSKGTIGRILIEGLRGYEVTPADLPDVDVRRYASLARIFARHDVVIHLAWNTETENAESETIAPDNQTMTWNVYRASLGARVPTVIMASSVHADRFSEWKGPGFLSSYGVPSPDSPYGASKVFMEALGRYYAARGLQVVCIRFGGVLPSQGLPPSANELLRAVWLSHRDCVGLVRTCLEAASIPDNYRLSTVSPKTRTGSMIGAIPWGGSRKMTLAFGEEEIVSRRNCSGGCLRQIRC